MRAVIQRVTRARVSVGEEVVGEIGNGILLLLGVSGRDTDGDAKYLLDKTVNLRIFDDAEGRMNESLVDQNAGLLIVSQFTLCGDSRKGRRPSFIDAASPEDANRLYEYFVSEARKIIKNVATGRFQAMMDVELVNDGPVTLLLDSERKF
jgi:D-tyrosyl-tRNA(Tyr) deacylase